MVQRTILSQIRSWYSVRKPYPAQFFLKPSCHGDSQAAGTSSVTLTNFSVQQRESRPQGEGLQLTTRSSDLITSFLFVMSAFMLFFYLLFIYFYFCLVLLLSFIYLVFMAMLVFHKASVIKFPFAINLSN